VIATGLATAVLTTIAFLWGHSPWIHFSLDPGADPLGGASLRYAVSLVAIAITVLLTLRDGSARVTLAEQARILELSHDTVVIRDANNVIQYWNEGAERLYGWTAAEAVNRNEHELLRTVFPVPLAEVEAALERALCLVLPSRREGYGAVVVEAAAVGTPSVVVAGEDNAAVELVVDGVNGIVARDADALAAAIVEVHEGGEELRRATRAWFVDRAPSLTAARSAQRILELIGRG
jgi:glycosyltransferase involved in cell wall biosynthesis